METDRWESTNPGRTERQVTEGEERKRQKIRRELEKVRGRCKSVQTERGV